MYIYVVCMGVRAKHRGLSLTTTPAAAALMLLMMLVHAMITGVH